jgi:hypothetical protein
MEGIRSRRKTAFVKQDKEKQTGLRELNQQDLFWKTKGGEIGRQTKGIEGEDKGKN